MIAAPIRTRSALLDDLERRSSEATAFAGGFEEHWLDLSGLPVRLRFAGPQLVGSLTLPFAHVATSPAEEPALTVRIWDTESTSIPGPEVRWSGDDYREHGIIRGFFGDGLYAIYQWGSRSLLVLDSERRQGFFWCERLERLGMLDCGSPLRTLLNIWLWQCEPGRQLLHTAAVGQPDGCALLVGNRGAGKSSTALACLDSPLQLLGDDYCIVTHGEPATISTLYCSAKADPLTLARLPALQDMLAPAYTPETEKVILDLHSHVPEKLLGRAPLRAVIVPRICGERETTSQPCSPGQALASLAPSTMLQLPGTDEASLSGLRAIVGAVPCHRLTLGTEPSLIPPAIESILERA